LGLGDWRAVLLRRRPVVVSVQLGTGPGRSHQPDRGFTLLGQVPVFTHLGFWVHNLGT
jgi:hypothetical protein